MRRTRMVRVDIDAWQKIQQTFPNTKSDAKRTVLLRNILDELDIPRKLNTEFTDTRSDKIVKRMLRGIL